MDLRSSRPQLLKPKTVRWLLYFTYLLLVALGGCCSTPLEMTEREYRSILSIEFSGNSSAIEVGGVMADGSLRKHTDSVVQGVEGFFEMRKSSVAPCVCQVPCTCPVLSDPDRILLYFHGGLISNESALGAAKRILGNMEADCSDFYPIFVNWDTAIGAAYMNDLFEVVNGRERPILAKFLSPFAVISDAGRAISRLPITYGAPGLEQRARARDRPTHRGGSARMGRHCEAEEISWRRKLQLHFIRQRACCCSREHPAHNDSDS